MKQVAVKQLPRKIDGYFRRVIDGGEIPSEQGLSLHLGITTRELRRWCDGKYPVAEEAAEVQHMIEMAYDRIMKESQQLMKTSNRNIAGYVTFLSKQKRFGGYTDKAEQKVDNTVRIIHGANMEESDFK